MYQTFTLYSNLMNFSDCYDFIRLHCIVYQNQDLTIKESFNFWLTTKSLNYFNTREQDEPTSQPVSKAEILSSTTPPPLTKPTRKSCIRRLLAKCKRILLALIVRFDGMSTYIIVEVEGSPYSLCPCQRRYQDVKYLHSGSDPVRPHSLKHFKCHVNLRNRLINPIDQFFFDATL